MFFLAILIGIYGYGIFALGVVGLLSPWIVGIWTMMLGTVFIVYIIQHATVISGLLEILRFSQNDKAATFSLLLLSILAVINFIGVLGPETSFDALWYHLTLPKLYIQEQSIRFIPGGLLYYSVMPKLGEMFFIPSLMFGNEIWAKSIQFLFGILTTVIIYKISRRYFSLSLSLLAGLVFYSNIVVAWESTVAYIDLIRAFFEIMALWAFLNWVDAKKSTWLYLSAAMVGFAISTKLLSLGSMFIFTTLIFYSFWKEKNRHGKNIFASILVYWLLSMGIVLPWLFFSYQSTGNFVYPFFTSIYPVGTPYTLSSLPHAVSDFIRLFLFADDPISPIYLIVIPLLFVYFSKLKPQIKMIAYYVFLSLFFWHITPRTGGGRFILPYLPAFSILVIALLDQAREQKIIYKTVFLSIFLIAFLTIGYRIVTNSRYLPIILGYQTKEQFLTKHLHFSYGDFYDTDGYFKRHIKPSDTVLLYGFHNLYYVNFPFIDSSYVKKGDSFTYIATQNTVLPERFKDWEAVYKNSKTFVTLYKKGDKIWTY